MYLSVAVLTLDWNSLYSAAMDGGTHNNGAPPQDLRSPRVRIANKRYADYEERDVVVTNAERNELHRKKKDTAHKAAAKQKNTKQRAVGRDKMSVDSCYQMPHHQCRRAQSQHQPKPFRQMQEHEQQRYDHS